MRFATQLGGQPVELTVVDDELKPDVAVNKARGLLERDRVHFVVGPVFRLVGGARTPEVFTAMALLVVYLRLAYQLFDITSEWRSDKALAGFGES